MLIQQISRFLKQQKGVVALETGLLISAFLLVMAIAVDFGMVVLKQGKLERVNYSLTSILRERMTLYSNSGNYTQTQAEALSQAQVNELHLLGRKLIESEELGMQVDVIYFDADKLERTVTSILSFTPNSTVVCRSPDKSMTSLQNLSPRSTSGRWMPLYRVTVCIPGNQSLFKRMLSIGSSEKVTDELSVSNIAIPR